ncbi:MAG: preprotein translocase subunit SecG [bacterium]
MPVFRAVIFVFHFGAALVLIASTVTHVSEREGLAGVVGGTTESAFGKAKGFEDQLVNWARYAGASFIVTSILLSVLPTF